MVIADENTVAVVGVNSEGKTAKWGNCLIAKGKPGERRWEQRYDYTPERSLNKIFGKQLIVWFKVVGTLLSVKSQIRLKRQVVKIYIQSWIFFHFSIHKPNDH